MSGTTLSINPFLCAELGLNGKQAIFVGLMLDGATFISSRFKHQCVKFDSGEIVSRHNGFPVATTAEAEHMLLELAEKNIFWVYQDHEGLWFMRGPALAGWNRSYDDDLNCIKANIDLHLDSVNGLGLKRKRLHGRKWEVLRLQTFERDNFTCTYCGAHGVPLACDHIYPFSLGGADDLENLTTACQTCNSSKGDKTLEEWRPSL